jgi:rRNA-processing protein FCF1
MDHLNETYAIILDTNSFGKTNKYNFVKSSVTICLSCLKDYSNIKIFMPSVVYEELKKHIRESINSLRENVNSSYFKNYIKVEDIDSIYEKKVNELDQFINKYNTIIIDCNKYSDLSQINNWYFNCNKPFSISKPKEFPDAMILSSSINYFRENKFDEIIMISEDGDIIEGVRENSDFEIKKNIQSVLTELIGVTEEEYRKCEKYIIENNILSNTESYSFYSYDSADEYEIDEIDYEINDISIIDKNTDEKYLQLCVNCNLNINGEFNLLDQNLSVYDREDPECSVYFYRNGKNLKIKNLDVFISISYDENNILKNTRYPFSIIYQ